MLFCHVKNTVEHRAQDTITKCNTENRTKLWQNTFNLKREKASRFQTFFHSILKVARIMEEGFVECTLFYCFHKKMAYVTETVESHLADFTSVSQLVSQNEKVHTRWG